MAIKQHETLSRADFDQALVLKRLNVSEVAKETGIPRTYLSEFRNGDRKLRPEHQAKLRDYFEAKGVEFDADPGPESRDDDAPQSPHPRLALATLCHFPVRGEIAPEAMRTVLDEIERNDKRIAELLTREAKRVTDFWGKPKGFDDQTGDDIRELFALLGANYVLVRYLTGIKNPLEQAPAGDTLQSVLVETLRETIERAGLVALLPQTALENEAPAEGATV